MFTLVQLPTMDGDPFAVRLQIHFVDGQGAQITLFEPPHDRSGWLPAPVGHPLEIHCLGCLCRLPTETDEKSNGASPPPMPADFPIPPGHYTWAQGLAGSPPSARAWLERHHCPKALSGISTRGPCGGGSTRPDPSTYTNATAEALVLLQPFPGGRYVSTTTDIRP